MHSLAISAKSPTNDTLQWLRLNAFDPSLLACRAKSDPDLQPRSPLGHPCSTSIPPISGKARPPLSASKLFFRPSDTWSRRSSLTNIHPSEMIKSCTKASDVYKTWVLASGASRNNSPLGITLKYPFFDQLRLFVSWTFMRGPRRRMQRTNYSSQPAMAAMFPQALFLFANTRSQCSECSAHSELGSASGHCRSEVF